LPVRIDLVGASVGTDAGGERTGSEMHVFITGDTPEDMVVLRDIVVETDIEPLLSKLETVHL